MGQSQDTKGQTCSLSISVSPQWRGIRAWIPLEGPSPALVVAPTPPFGAAQKSLGQSANPTILSLEAALETNDWFTLGKRASVWKGWLLGATCPVGGAVAGSQGGSSSPDRDRRGCGTRGVTTGDFTGISSLDHGLPFQLLLLPIKLLPRPRLSPPQLQG